MSYELVVTAAFGQYGVGSRITDPTTIATIEASDAANRVVRVPVGGSPTAADPVLLPTDDIIIRRDGVERVINSADLWRLRPMKILSREVAELRQEMLRRGGDLYVWKQDYNPPIAPMTPYIGPDGNWHYKDCVYPEWSGIGTVPYPPGTWYVNIRNGIIDQVDFD